jgi:YVTN family beta-propeller protein
VCPTAAAYDNGTGDVFIGNSCDNNVSVISDSTFRVVANISVRLDPEAAAYDWGTHQMFIAECSDSSVSVINDTNFSVVTFFGIPACAFGLGYDSGKHEMFVAASSTDFVYVVSDTNDSIVAKIPVGYSPGGHLAYDSANGEVFVANFGSDNVSVISDVTNKVVATIALPTSSGPQETTFDSGNGDVYVSESGNVSVISGATNSIVATIHNLGYSVGIIYGEGTGNVFVESRSGSNVTVISDSTNQVAQVVSTGSSTSPDAIAFDSATGDVYTADYNTASASVIGPPGPPTHQVTFSESGLPSRTSWSVTLNGSTLTSTTGTINFSEPSGAYSFTVGAVAGYAPHPASGTLTVGTGGATQSIAFTSSQTYAVTFTEGGLANGTTWSVTLNGSSMSSTTNTVVFSEPDGTYSFSIGTLVGERSNISSGSIHVSGAAVGRSITFVSTSAAHYAVTFTETGLPAGSTWQVILNGTTQSSSTTGTTFSEPNGTFGFETSSSTDYAPVPSSGSVTVEGSSVTQGIIYWEVYPLAFTEGGLPPGSNWSVTLTKTTTGPVLVAGLVQASVTRWSDGAATIRFSASNGTYDYTSSAAGYTGASGSVTVSGSSPPPTSLSFSVTPSSSSSGVPLLDWVAIGVVVVAVAVIATVVLRRRRTGGPPDSPPSPPS